MTATALLPPPLLPLLLLLLQGAARPLAAAAAAGDGHCGGYPAAGAQHGAGQGPAHEREGGVDGDLIHGHLVGEGGQVG